MCFTRFFTRTKGLQTLQYGHKTDLDIEGCHFYEDIFPFSSTGSKTTTNTEDITPLPTIDDTLQDCSPTEELITNIPTVSPETQT